MNNQRMIGRPAFGFENFGHCVFIAGIGRQAIHRFGGQTQKLTGAQSFCSLLHVRGVVA